MPYYNPVREKVLQSIREQGLLRAGDRVAVAVSGGADSVALLRVLLELKDELGIVLAVAHFNHGLRGADSDADQAFVAELATRLGLEFYAGIGDVRDHAILNKLSVEAAGRELRYQWFARLAGAKRLNAVATAHTLDDQAETVLLKFLRGAGTKGLAGIWPVVELEDSGVSAGAKAPTQEGASYGAAKAAPLQNNASAVRVVRPLLGVSRDPVEAYLEGLGQAWREDESNLDHRFLRNRVRHELLPLLEREYNPNIRRALSDLADLSRVEEEYWNEQVERELAARATASQLRVGDFPQLPLALQRRLLKRFAEGEGVTLDFEHVEKLRRCALGQLSRTELPGGRIAVYAKQWLELRSAAQTTGEAYEVALPIPGEVYIPELKLTLRATIVPQQFGRELAPGELLSRELVGTELTIRNWCPGDRFWPAHSRSEEKLKRLFAEQRIVAQERVSWPVALCGTDIVWVRGFPVAKTHVWSGAGDAVRIEAVEVEG